MKKNIFLFGFVNCAAYIVLFLTLKYLNLLHLSGFRMLNYLLLLIFSIVQVKGWVKQSGGYMPSLKAFVAILVTGGWSFILFGAFMFIYSLSDASAIELYFSVYGKLGSMYAFIIALEGIAGSVIVALVAMMYSNMFFTGEAPPPQS